MIAFATSNKFKLLEAGALFPNILPMAVELPEIQDPDVVAVVREKLLHVSRLNLGHAIIVEDTGLYVESWSNLPGALIKWFVDGIGTKRLAELFLEGNQLVPAQAVSAVGISFQNKVEIWTGFTLGNIVTPRGEELGWNSIFEETSTRKTFGELSFKERLAVSMRNEPLRKAKEWIENQSRTTMMTLDT